MVDESTKTESCCRLGRGFHPKDTKLPKDTQSFAALFKALADETRLEILGLLASAGIPLCVCEVENQVKHLSQPTISHHLRQLREAGLVMAERRGTWVYYTLCPQAIAQLKRFVGLIGG
jgi:ArsR family transcriptional regulator